MLSYDEAKEVLGPVDDTVIADVVRVGATREELAEALAWIGSDDMLMREGKPPPSGRVATLVEILEADQLEDDGAGPGADASPYPASFPE